MKTLQCLTGWVVAVGLTLGTAAVSRAQTSSSQQSGLGSGASTGQGTSSSSGQLSGADSSGIPSTSSSSSRSGTGRALSTMDDGLPGNSGKLNDQQMDKVRNSERQKKLVEDTEKLVALVNQLKDDVDKSNKDTLSLDVVRKADEIEKLARSVRDKMKGT